jgi:glycosyltransferase involved in cell wall biosynthesis
MIDVSVVIPTFNRRQDICVALDSVFHQPGTKVECIVVDDGSTDGTVSHIRERYKDRPLVVIEKPRRSGAQASRNLGMAVAQGEYVTFLDSDDYFEPDTLAKRVALCRETSLDALFSGYRVMFKGRRWNMVKDVHTGARPCPQNYAVALQNFNISPMIVIMYRRAVHPELKLDESLASGHDDDLALHLIRTCRYGFDDILAATIIQHAGDRISSTKNLVIGDAQLLKKYATDVLQNLGQGYLNRRRARALAGLWSVGQFKRSALLRPQGPDRGSMPVALVIGVFYLPRIILAGLRKRAVMAAARALL